MSYPLKRSRSFKRIPLDGNVRRRASSLARQKAARTAVSSQKRISNFIAQDIPRALYGFSGIPRQRKAFLKYAGEITLTSAGVNIAHLFRLNSLHDPDYTGVGHQPLGHDQWAQLYNRYTVVKATIKATPIRDANTNVVPGLLRIGVIDSSGGVSSNAMTIAEDTRYTDWTHSGLLAGGSSAGSAKRPDTVRQEVDMAKFFNTKDLMTAVDTDVYSAPFASSPTDTCWGAVVVSPINGNTPGACNVLVEIEFEAIFTEPKQLTAS